MSLTRTKPTSTSQPIAIECFKNKNPQLVYVDQDYDQDEKDIVRELTTTGTFYMLPYIEKNQTQRLFVSGMSGSGKSMFIRSYIDTLRSMKGYKRNKVWMFTKNANEDPAFKDLDNMEIVDTSDTEELFKVKYTQFEKCIVVFDDWESGWDESVTNFFRQLMHQLLEFSRKQHVQIVVATHVTQQGPKTQKLIFECDTYILFHKNNFNSVQKFLVSYMDYRQRDVRFVKYLPGRHIVVRKSSPTHLLCDKKILMV